MAEIVHGRRMYQIMRSGNPTLKSQNEAEIEVAGPELVQSLTDLGLIDEYRLYLHPVVVGHGKPFFAGPRPPLRLVSSERIDGDVMRLTYVPA